MRAEAELDGLKNDIADRKYFARAILGLTICWLAMVLFLVVLVGMGWLILGEKVLLALIGAGTVNVLALFHHVAKYLYSREK